MTRLSVRARRDERGANIVEFAVVALVLFTLFFGLVDISLVEIGNTAATNAARAGARVGALNPESADVEGSTRYNAIRDAVRARLAGVVTLDPSFDLDGIDVQCIDGTDGVTVRAAGCVGTTVPLIPERDRIRVTLRWVHRGISPFVSNRTKTDSATVAIVGAGAVAVPPTDCKITGASVNTAYPSIGSANPSGTLTSPVTLTVSTNGLCSSGFSTTFFTGTETGSPPASTKVAMASIGGTSSFQATLSPSLTWTVGEKSFQFTNGLNPPAEVFYTSVSAKITVVSNAQCAFVAAGVNPPSNNPPSVRVQNTISASNPTSVLRTSTPAASITVWAVSTTECLNKTVLATYTPSVAGTEQHQAFTTRGTSATSSCGGVTSGQTGICYTWAIPTSLAWNLGLKSFTFDDNNASGTGVVAWPGAVATVQVNQAPPACTISVRFASDSTFATTITSLQVDEKGAQGTGLLKTPFAIRVTQELASECLNGIWVQWDRGRGFGDVSLPKHCKMQLVSGTAPAPDTHTIAVPAREAVPLTTTSSSCPNAPTALPISSAGTNRHWLPTGNVTFRFWHGDPAVVTNPQLTPLSPATLSLFE